MFLPHSSLTVWSPRQEVQTFLCFCWASLLCLEDLWRTYNLPLTHTGPPNLPHWSPLQCHALYAQFWKNKRDVCFFIKIFVIGACFLSTRHLHHLTFTWPFGVHIYNFVCSLFWIKMETTPHAGRVHERDWWCSKSLHRMNANSLSINTYIYIFPHNLCQMQVFKLVVNS